MLVFICQSLFAERVINLSTVRNSKIHELSSLVVKEAYKKAGIRLQIHVLPTENALYVANSGIVDGEISRERNIRQQYSNLLRVPISVNFISGVAFSRNPKLDIDGWSSLDPYRIGIIKGCDFAARGTRGMNVRIMDSNEKAFTALQKRKVDVVILPLVDGLQTLQEQNIEGVYVIRPSLADIPLYHYIHSSQSHLIPKLTKILRKMKKSGRIKRIRQAYLAKLMMKL
ncbi:MAG: transporter substrate-binding domain-containing protein [Thiovulaceae bacterium]|nr:transporter substrate-binding domain-containing protein [Sulfurimonadaceae bacterium]